MLSFPLAFQRYNYGLSDLLRDMSDRPMICLGAVMTLGRVTRMAVPSRKTVRARKADAQQLGNGVTAAVGRGRQTVFAVPTLGPAIKAARELTDLSQRDVARRLGLSSASVAQWESVGSNYVVPMFDNLWGVSKLLNVPISKLVGETAGETQKATPLIWPQNETEASLLALFRVLPDATRDECLSKIYAALGGTSSR
jgi:transcriptional regulator with XRE-family HTH domain